MKIKDINEICSSNVFLAEKMTEEKLRTAKYSYWFKRLDTIYFVFADSDEMAVFKPQYAENSGRNTMKTPKKFLSNNVSDNDFILITVDEAIKKVKNEENLEYIVKLGDSWCWSDICYDEDSNTFVIDSYHDSSLDPGDITHSRRRDVSLNEVISLLKSENKYGEYEIGRLKEIFGEDFECKITNDL